MGLFVPISAAAIALDHQNIATIPAGADSETASFSTEYPRDSHARIYGVA